MVGQNIQQVRKYTSQENNIWWRCNAYTDDTYLATLWKYVVVVECTHSLSAHQQVRWLLASRWLRDKEKTMNEWESIAQHDMHIGILLVKTNENNKGIIKIHDPIMTTPRYVSGILYFRWLWCYKIWQR